MALFAAAPGPPLDGFVDVLWMYADSGQPHPRERLLPDGASELVINLGDEPMIVYDRPDAAVPAAFRAAVICGAHDRPFAIDTASPTAVFGIHFKPGGAFPFFRAPADALRGLHVDLEDLWGRLAVEDLRDRLRAAPTPQACFAIARRALLGQLAGSPARHPAVEWALGEFLRAPQAVAMAQVVGRIGLSQRRFIERFAAEVGLTPKLFCRIQRFQAALREIERGRPPAWATLALDCGYYDQAHLIRDFQAFAGLSPATYLDQRSDHFNHVPMSTMIIDQ